MVRDATKLRITRQQVSDCLAFPVPLCREAVSRTFPFGSETEWWELSAQVSVQPTPPWFLTMAACWVSSSFNFVQYLNFLPINSPLLQRPATGGFLSYPKSFTNTVGQLSKLSRKPYNNFKKCFVPKYTLNTFSMKFFKHHYVCQIWTLSVRKLEGSTVAPSTECPTHTPALSLQLQLLPSGHTNGSSKIAILQSQVLGSCVRQTL